MSPSLPPAINGPSAWFGPDMASRNDWVYPLSPSEIEEIRRAATPWMTQNPAGITAGAFELPELAPRLLAIRHEVLQGRGFALLRGLPVDEWPRELSAAAFCGLGVHLGHLRAQNARGDLLGHVQDVGLRSDDPNVRLYQTAERQTFHTDSCDIVGLLCLQDAKQGGVSALVSSITMWNVMRER